jgi:hypothetical protein
MRSLFRDSLRPVRQLAGRFVIPATSSQEAYTESHGNLRVAASHLAWNMLPGDYLEFGVWNGASFVQAFQALEYHRRIVFDNNPGIRDTDDFQRWWGNPPRLFAFDSFEGLPGGESERHTDYHAGAFACSEQQFLANVTSALVPRDRVVTVPGFYDASLTRNIAAQHRLTRASLVMIDCDLYESTVPVLRFLTDLLHQGSIVIFHDWFRFAGRRDRGERRACEEWLAANPQLELEPFWQEGPQAKAFLVHRADD